MHRKVQGFLLFLMILTLLLAGCSKNPATDKYGPSWDVTLELPVVSSDKHLR